MRKIKSLFTKIREKYRKIKQRFAEFSKRNWEDTGKLLYWMSILIFSLSMGLMSGDFMRPQWAGVLLTTVVVGLLMIFILWLTKKILRLFLRNGITELLSWMLLCLLCIFVLTGDSYAAGMTENLLFAVVFSLVVALFLKSLWALFHHKVHTKAIFITLTLTGIPMVAVIVLLCIGGFPDTYITKYLELSAESGNTVALTVQEKAEFEKNMENGSYTVMKVTYGTTGKEDIASDRTDISRFAQNEDISGMLKEQYQGYSLEEVPMTGVVWYPKEKDNCPTVFIIHGNHNWITDSYLGYEYLGTYLASHGYVVISVDENACNQLSNENDGRAVLLLENMRQVEKFNYQEENPLYQKMDYNNLALAGHSRGGEAVATAYLFNDLNYYPDNGKCSFSYHFSIKSLIAIAPTYGQYEPADRNVELTDVNYMVLHGANDQDVSTFMGMEQYENISFSGEKDCIKTSLYIAGLNHGQFNSLWGKYDFAEPVNRILNVENFLSQQEQQQIAKIFIKTFLDTTLSMEEFPKENSNMELLTDCQKYSEFLPKTLYVQSYDTSDSTTLCDFEEDARLETGSMDKVRIRAKNVNSWREEKLNFSSGESRENYAVVLKWSQKEVEEMPQIEFSMPEIDLTNAEFRFDIMDMNEEFAEEDVEFLEAEVIFTDENGKETGVRVSDYKTVYPAFPVRLNKLQYLFGTAEYKHQFQTISIPVKELSGVDVTEISGITLRFPQEDGKVAIDNVKIAPVLTEKYTK